MELIVVIAIMAVLIGVIAPTLVYNVEKAKLSKDKNATDLVYNAFVNLAVDSEINSEVIGKEYLFVISEGETSFPKDGQQLGGQIFLNENVANQIAEYLAAETITFSSKQFQEGKMHVAVGNTGKVIIWMESGDSVKYDRDFFINCESHEEYEEFTELME
jgi:hypothetical protein